MKYTLAPKIALRYFISRKSHGAVNIISAISVAGVAVATAAIIVVLSVFNGFSHLAHSRFSAIDPDILVVPAEGKVILDSDSLARKISSVDGVDVVAPTLTERGLIFVDDDTQIPVVFKGVDENFSQIVNLDEITEYYFQRSQADTLPGAAVSVGVSSQLNALPGKTFDLYTLRRVGRINPANPAGAFFSASLGIDRILKIEQMEFDADHIVIPLDVARDLLQYFDDEASALEIRTAPGKNIDRVGRELQNLLGPQFTVQLREQQHAESYRMISIEKWVTFSMLIFILVIATFNIISTLSLMVIEKRDNMATLLYLGAKRSTLRSVFAWMGALITAVGGVIGICVGIALALAQQWGGFIKLSGDAANLSVTEYPVRVEGSDILAVAVLVCVVALLTALSTRVFTRKIA